MVETIIPFQFIMDVSEAGYLKIMVVIHASRVLDDGETEATIEGDVELIGGGTTRARIRVYDGEQKIGVSVEGDDVELILTRLISDSVDKLYFSVTLTTSPNPPVL